MSFPPPLQQLAGRIAAVVALTPEVLNAGSCAPHVSGLVGYSLDDP